MNQQKKLESMLVIAAGFVGLWFVYNAKWMLIAAFLVALVGALSVKLTSGITWLWFKLAQILGWVNSKVLLGIVFYLFLFPISFLMKIFSKTALILNSGKSSYFSERNHTYKPEDLENIW